MVVPSVGAATAPDTKPGVVADDVLVARISFVDSHDSIEAVERAVVDAGADDPWLRTVANSMSCLSSRICFIA